MSITHDIYKLFDCNPPVHAWGTFFDISKAFDKVCHDGLIFETKYIGPRLSLAKVAQKPSKRLTATGGVPLGTLLRPLPVIYIYTHI